LTLYQTEQECGDGKNDWNGAIHSWKLMNHYLSNGANVYNYWNISLEKGGISRWGWAQNSLVVIDPETKSFNYTLEYYVMKHFSHYIQHGATRLKTEGYGNLLAFLNPDESIVVTVGNFENEETPMKIKWENHLIRPVLSANSINTFLIK
jgi:glucosylceramidase